MKNRFKNIGVILLTAIYGLAIGMATNSQLYVDQEATNGSHHQVYFSKVTSTVFGTNPESENTVNNPNSFRGPNSQQTFLSFSALVRLQEQSGKTKFSQYSNFSKNFLILLRKADLIFPFQYFW